MQMVKRILGGFFLTLIFLWLFAPKIELYYLLEKSLKKNNIILSNETVTDTWYGLNISNADLYIELNGDTMKVANAVELNLNFFFLYNTLTINQVTMDKALSKLAPKSINNLNARYSILNPLKVELDGDGSFGVLDGEVRLIERKVEILFPVAKDLKTIQKFLKKNKEKGWLYETNY